MLFNTVEYILFLPIVVSVYYLIPEKIRYIWLLIVSYYFYMHWNPLYIVLLLFCTVITYIGGLCMEKYENRKRLCLILCVGADLGILAFFKYVSFGILMWIFIFAIAVHSLNYMYVAGFAEDEWERIVMHSFYGDKGKIENLYLGSSHVYCDLDPYQLDSLNGQYNFNLATPIQLMNGTYYLLREADQRNELSHVYVELYYRVSSKNNFDKDRDPIEETFLQNTRIADYMRISLNKMCYLATMADAEKCPDIFFGFSRYRMHLDDWDYVRTAIERKRSGEYASFQYHVDYDDGNGHMEYLPRGRYYTSRALPDQGRIFFQERVLAQEPMAEKSERYLRKIISYCQKREIPITLFISPMYELQLLSTEHYDNYLNQVREIAAEYGVDIYDFNLAREEYLPIQKTKYFLDMGHLNSAGAELYTDFFYKIVSGDAKENRKYFYDTYEEKLAYAEPEVYGIYYRDEPGEDGETTIRNMFVASNRSEGMEYRITMTPTTEGDAEPYMLQDFCENRAFQVDNREHGICAITYRMKETSGEEETIEIAY